MYVDNPELLFVQLPAPGCLGDACSERAACVFSTFIPLDGVSPSIHSLWLPSSLAAEQDQEGPSQRY